MRAFLQQVSDSDALAESGLKVIAYFDALVEHRATLEACVRAAAALSRCVAGLRDASSSASVRFNRRGVAAEGPSRPTTRRPVRIGDRAVGEVWLERKDSPAALDELIVERMAMAAGVLWRGSPRPRTSVSALVEAAVGAATAADDRRRAFGLLGLSADRPVDVLAVASVEPDELVASLRSLQEAVRESGRNGSPPAACSTLLGNVGIVLAQPGWTIALPDRLVAGLVRGAAVAQLPEAWTRAQTALRFSRLLGFGNVVDHAELGALTALAELSPDAVAANADLRAIRELTATSRGRAALEALEQRVASGSVRETAAALFLHHSSVRYRLKHAEECLGVDLQDPRGRLRAELAVVLWRLTSA